MTVTWETVPIFISSTFSDMHAERDYLLKRVFPELEEWCERRKLRLVVIDLRWGVTEADATRNKNVVGVCLDRIDECRPFFLCFIGQRYGWVPAPGDISPATIAQFPSLADVVRDERPSVTELEIRHAVLSPFHVQGNRSAPAQHAFFYLRDPSYLGELPARLRDVYTGPDGDRLKHLRDTVLPRAGVPLRSYTAEFRTDAGFTSPELALPLMCPSAVPANISTWRATWARAGVPVTGAAVADGTPEADKAREHNARLTQGRLAGFTVIETSRPLRDAVLHDLQAAIRERFPGRDEPGEADALRRELDQHDQTRFLLTQGYIERARAFDALNSWLADPDDLRLFVLTAEGGMGKSSLLARWVTRQRKEPGGATCHLRFVGASDRSGTVDDLLRFLAEELHRHPVGKIPEPPPADPRRLRQLWPDLLATAGRSGLTVLVLDGLNQLQTGLRDLEWLPRPLPPGVKVAVSFRRNDPEAEELYRSLRGRADVLLTEVPAFDDLADRRVLVDTYLSQYLKQLDDDAVEQLVAFPGSRNPLFLKVALSELRVFGSFANLREKIRHDLGEEPVSAFGGMLRRVESDPAYSALDARVAVPLLFGFLAHSRRGLTVGELADLFVRCYPWPAAVGEAERRETATDAVHLYLRQVRPFLARREGRFDFFYESFRLAALARYADRHPWHSLLADFFRDEPAHLPDGGVNSHKAEEEPWQQLRAEKWDDLATTLTDIRFLTSKCAAGMVADLQADYAATLEALPEAQAEAATLRERAERMRDFVAALVKGDTSPPVPMPAHIPTEEDLAREGERLRQAPTRLDRVRQFARFVSAEAAHLEHAPAISGLFLQQALNHADGGPVVAAAERALTEGLAPPLFRRHPRQRRRFTARPMLLRTLTGHTGLTTGTAITPDGHLSVTGGWDRTVRAWDVATGTCLRTFTGHTDQVSAVALTPDGRLAASCAEDRTVRLWDVSSGVCLHTFGPLAEPVEHVALAHDGRILLAGGTGGGLWTWDAVTGESRTTARCLGRVTVQARLTPDGRAVFLPGPGGEVTLIDPATGQTLRKFEGHPVLPPPAARRSDSSINLNQIPGMYDAGAHRTALSLDGRLAASATKTGNVRLWDPHTGDRVLELGLREGYPDGLVFTPDRRLLLTRKSQRISLWDVATGECRRRLSAVWGRIWGDGDAVALGADGSVLLLVAAGQGVAVLDLTAEAEPARASGDDIKQLALGERAKVAVAGYPPGCWDLSSGERTGALSNADTSTLLTTSPDGTMAIGTLGKDDALGVWRVPDRKRVAELRGHTRLVSACLITPDGTTAVSIAAGTLRVWEIPSGRCLGVGGVPCRLERLRLAGDGRTAVTAGSNGLVVWDLASASPLRIVAGPGVDVYALDLTPDARLALVGSRDGTVRMWDLETGECLHRQEGHPNGTAAARISPDGRVAVTCGLDGHVGLWDLATGRRLHTSPKYSGSVWEVSVAPDGKTAVTGSGRGGDLVGEVRAWDLTTGRCLAVLPARQGVEAMTPLRADGWFAFTEGAGVSFVSLEGIEGGPAVVTPTRHWHATSGWDEAVTTSCPRCGRAFPPPAPPDLRCACPGCGQPILLNSFVLDRRGQFPDVAALPASNPAPRSGDVVQAAMRLAFDNPESVLAPHLRGAAAEELRQRLRILAGSGDAGGAGEATVGLALLGEDARATIRADGRRAGSVHLVLRRLGNRLGQVFSASRPGEVADAWVGAPRSGGFEFGRAVVALTVAFGAYPVNASMVAQGLSPTTRPLWLAEFWAHTLVPLNDFVYNWAVVLDTFGKLLGERGVLAPTLAALPAARNLRWQNHQGLPLSRTLPHPRSESETIALALDSVCAIPPALEFVRSWCLRQLAPQLKESGLAAEGVILALTILSHRYNARREALETLLSGEELTAALEPASPLRFLLDLVRGCGLPPWARYRALARLAEAFRDSGVLDEALAAARELPPELRTWALERLSRLLPTKMRPTLLGQALAAARLTADPDNRSRALAGLSLHFPPLLAHRLLMEALEQVEAVPEAEDREKLLDCLRPHLAGHHDLLDRCSNVGRLAPAILAYAPQAAAIGPRVAELVPQLVLGAVVHDLARDTRLAVDPEALWECVLGPRGDEALAELHARGEAASLPLTRTAAGILDALIEQRRLDVVRPLLPLLDRPEPDTAPVLERWRCHPDVTVRQHATHLCAAAEGVSERTLPGLLGLLTAEDEVVRHRAALALHGPTPFSLRPHTSVSRLGTGAMRLLARAWRQHVGRHAHLGTVLYRLYPAISQDDPGAIREWTDAGTKGDAESLHCLRRIEKPTPPVWAALLEALGSGYAPVVREVSEAICFLLFLEQDPAGGWDACVRTLRGMDRTMLATRKVLLDGPALVVRSPEGDWAKTAPSLAEIMARPESLWRTGLAAGAAVAYRTKEYTQAVETAARAATAETVRVLMRRLTALFSERVCDESDLFPLRLNLLAVLAHVAELAPDLVRGPNESAEEPLARVVARHPLRRTRIDALKLLAQQAELGPVAWDAVRLLVRDHPEAAPTAQEIASRTIPAGEVAWESLYAGLYDPSAAAARAAGLLLTALIQNPNCPAARRREAADALATAAGSANSRRPVYVVIAETIPDRGWTLSLRRLGRLDEILRNLHEGRTP